RCGPSDQLMAYCLFTLAAIWIAMSVAAVPGLVLHATMSMATLFRTVSARWHVQPVSPSWASVVLRVPSRSVTSATVHTVSGLPGLRSANWRCAQADQLCVEAL